MLTVIAKGLVWHSYIKEGKKYSLFVTFLQSNSQSIYHPQHKKRSIVQKFDRGLTGETNAS